MYTRLTSELLKLITDPAIPKDGTPACSEELSEWRQFIVSLQGKEKLSPLEVFRLMGLLYGRGVNMEANIFGVLLWELLWEYRNPISSQLAVCLDDPNNLYEITAALLQEKERLTKPDEALTAHQHDISTTLNYFNLNYKDSFIEHLRCLDAAKLYTPQSGPTLLKKIRATNDLHLRMLNQLFQVIFCEHYDSANYMAINLGIFAKSFYERFVQLDLEIVLSLYDQIEHLEIFYDALMIVSFAKFPADDDESLFTPERKKKLIHAFLSDIEASRALIRVVKYAVKNHVNVNLLLSPECLEQIAKFPELLSNKGIEDFFKLYEAEKIKQPKTDIGKLFVDHITIIEPEQLETVIVDTADFPKDVAKIVAGYAPPIKFTVQGELHRIFKQLERHTIDWHSGDSEVSQLKSITYGKKDLRTLKELIFLVAENISGSDRHSMHSDGSKQKLFLELDRELKTLLHHLAKPIHTQERELLLLEIKEEDRMHYTSRLPPYLTYPLFASIRTLSLVRAPSAGEIKHREKFDTVRRFVEKNMNQRVAKIASLTSSNSASSSSSCSSLVSSSVSSSSSSSSSVSSFASSSSSSGSLVSSSSAVSSAASSPRFRFAHEGSGSVAAGDDVSVGVGFSVEERDGLTYV